MQVFPFISLVVGSVGALGITPVDFIYPVAMYIAVRKPKGLGALVNWAIIVVYTVVGVMGTVAAVRGIVLDVKNYSAFANLGVV